MFKSLFGLVEDVAKIVTTPTEVALDVTRASTKPIADMAADLTKEIKNGLKDLTEE